MTTMAEKPLEEAALHAAALFQDADLQTREAYLQAIAHALGIDDKPEDDKLEKDKLKLQAALLDAIHDTIGPKPLLHRANFARAVIAVLDMDARSVVSGDVRRNRSWT